MYRCAVCTKMGVVSDSFVMEISLLFIAFILYLYYHVTKTFKHWKYSGIKYVKPVPFFGHFLYSLVKRKHNALLHQDMYNEFPHERYFGIFVFQTPTLVIKDPQLIRHIMIKDFSYFYNRTFKVDEELDPLAAHLVFLSDQRWKTVRNKLAPVFTSAKLKIMHTHMEECVYELQNYLHESIKVNNLIEMRECMANFSTDVIGSCVYGIQSNALKDPDNEFRRIGRDIFAHPYRRLIKMFLTSLHPLIPKLLNFKTQLPETELSFTNFVQNTIQYREENNIKCNDFIQLLMEIKSNNTDVSESRKEKYVNGNTNKGVDTDVVLDVKLMAASAFAFLAAGFETTSTTMSYCFLELAVNLDVQDKMRQEILDKLAENDGKITYDIIRTLKYTDKVISETLRKYPPVINELARECTKTYQLPDSNLLIGKGINVIIPVYAIHHDPRYYPEPNRFDPERFSEENKKTRPEGTYLPFGDGPRICIGQRFALMEMKITFCRILPNFEFRMSNKTNYPVEFDPAGVFLTPLNGIWLNVYERK